MSDSTAGKRTGAVRGIAVRTSRRGPMREIEQATARQGAGLEEDIAVSPRRGVTLLAAHQWQTTIKELGVDLPWHTRRANVLVEGLELGELIGQTVRLGEALVEILGETEPCEMMDQQCPGLLAALIPNRRAGVHGRIVAGGRLKIGDAVEVT